MWTQAGGGRHRRRGFFLNTVMNEAGEAGIPIIGDRSIMNDNVHYVRLTYTVGTLQSRTTP